MKGWKEVNIGSLGKVITGNTPLTSDREFYGGSYPFIKPTDMDLDRRRVSKWEENYSDKAFKKFKNAYIPAGSTGVVTIGTVGEKIFQSNHNCFTNQSVNVVIPNEELYDKDFVYYLLKYNLPKVSSANPGTASGRHHVSKSNFCSINVKVPYHKSTQIKIGSTLSAYDDLIENNLKRIKLLEELAQRTYEEWFVKFRVNGKNLDVNKETGLPDGWERKHLFEIANVFYGFPFKANQFNSEGKGTPIIRIRNIHQSNTNDFSTEIVDTKYWVEKGDLLLGMDGEFYINNWSGPRAYLVQRSCNVKSKDKFLHGYLSQAIVPPVKFFEATISGTTVAHLGKSHLESIEILIPTKKIFQMLEIFNNLLDLKIKLSIQNRLLKESRDILLPRLMSGKIEVQGLRVEELAIAAEPETIFKSR
jgi:type I restriction enzyme S subunit